MHQMRTRKPQPLVPLSPQRNNHHPNRKNAERRWENLTQSQTVITDTEDTCPALWKDSSTPFREMRWHPSVVPQLLHLLFFREEVRI
mmetsp:Transcript_6253/g.12342  ORF Transcript_6253/g.12342 Transcript_6253/m.12342 type:complete len:87 (-) Transcript_6253:369-629(-)